MKMLIPIFSAILFISTISAMAQTVTLTATNGQPSSFTCTTNQIITINSFIQNNTLNNAGEADIFFNNGQSIPIYSYNYGVQSKQLAGTGSISTVFTGGAVFTGVTNITVLANFNGTVAALTFTATTPTAQSLIPANAVVIPTDATGPVQIVLESSSDLVNWTSSLPGTYGSTYTNRFFRVRAIAQ